MTTPAALRARGIRKAYVEGVTVLDGVELTVPPGCIAALVGANGSGKSTLVKILSGFHRPDEGFIEIRGERIEGITPDLLRSAGVRFVHQEPTIVGGVSVLENLAAGSYETLGGRIRWRKERRRVRALLEEWRIPVDPSTNVARLSAAMVAKLALLKAIRMRPGDEPVHAIVLDEPTAALGREDADELLGWLRDIAQQQGVGILFISHRIEEILAFADSVAVLREGRIIVDGPTAGLSATALVEHIVGGALGEYYPQREEATSEDAVLVVKGATGSGVDMLTFTLAAGETLGITGLPGSGFESIPLLLMDPQYAEAGTLTLDDRELSLRSTSIRARVRLGMALVPADRKRTALATELSVRENIALPRLKQFRVSGVHLLSREKRDAEGLIARFGISTQSPATAASRLSGGNQQKVVLAKWMSTEPRVLIVHEPTQAVDVGAKAEIFALLSEASARGVATVIVSVEHEDLAHLCDRVLVLADGVVSAELSGSGLTGGSLAAATLAGTPA
ncbi:sugar ABC transporter ATP-binding protein [Microbacterium shaanxiense]